MAMPKNYLQRSDSVKKTALTMRRSGNTPKEIREKLDVPESTLRKWVAAAKAAGTFETGQGDVACPAPRKPNSGFHSRKVSDADILKIDKLAKKKTFLFANEFKKFIPGLERVNSSTIQTFSGPPQLIKSVIFTAKLRRSCLMHDSVKIMRGQFRGPMPPSRPHLPNLKPRPSGLMGAHPSLPSAAGPVAEQMNRVAGKLADYMRQNLEDLLKDLSQQGNPEATIKGLQLKLEKMQYQQQQEIAKIKYNAGLIMMRMRSSMKQEKQRAITECRKEAEINKQKAIAETKKKQWCANCEKEAIFYCCWNTSYCDYPCQQSHWGVHMSSCAQNNQEQSEQDISKPEAVDPQHFPDDSSMMVDNH